jgi:hypothetical protein
MATITLFMTGTDETDATDHGFLWDDLSSAREYVEEADGDLRIFRIEVPTSAAKVSEVAVHTEAEARDYAGRVPAGLRSPTLEASLRVYGITD